MRTFSLVRRVAVGTLASALAAVPLSITSTASAATSTTIRLALPTAISYGDRHTTITGTLETLAVDSQRLGGKPVTLVMYAADGTTVLADLGTVTTADDGTFSLSTTVPGPGGLRATFAGDDTYARGVGQTEVPVTSHLPGRIQLDPLPTTVDPNADFTISGQVQEQTPDGSWEPASWAYLEVYPGNKTQYTGPDGRFSFTAHESVPTDWKVSAAPGIGNFAAASTTPAEFVNVPPQPTRITSLTVHSNGVAQKGLTLTVHADILAGGQWKPYTGVLDLFFQPKGSTGRQGGAMGRSGLSINADGDQVYSDIIGPYLRIPPASGTGLSSLVSEDGSWKAEIEQVTAAPGQTGITASSSDVVPTVVQKYATSVVNKSIVSTGRSRYLHASLWEPVWNLGGSPGYIGMVPHQPVKLYYRYRTSSTWHYVTTTSTDGNGRLSVKLTGTHRYYRLVYSGSALYAGTTSSQIYFSS